MKKMTQYTTMAAIIGCGSTPLLFGAGFQLQERSVSGLGRAYSGEAAIADDAAVVEREGVTMVVDSLSYQYLLGAEVDYEEGLQGSAFVVNNPNAAATCGCGNSFAI